MTNLQVLQDLPQWRRTQRYLLHVGDEDIVIFKHQTLFGFRLMAGYVDMLPEQDTSYSELNICCGADTPPYDEMFGKILSIISTNPPEDPFKGIPQTSKIKPYYNDPEFCEIIEKTISSSIKITIVITPVIQEAINKGGALTRMDPIHYPARYNRKVPLKVLMIKTVKSELPLFLPGAGETPSAIKGNEYYVSVNRYGAVTALFENGQGLGLKPDEFEVVEFHK